MQTFVKWVGLLCGSLLCSSLLGIAAAAAESNAPKSDGGQSNYGQRDEVRQFAAEMAADHGFNADGIVTVLHQAEYKQSIIDAISRPAERVLTWADYQDIFLTDKRVAEGRRFMMTHKEALIRAEQIYGVPPVIITAIIGVETMYGRIRGNYRVLDALSTLAFDYPPRSSFFRKELKEFLLLVREQNQVITDLKGSYAGAMGYGQFIPSSYRAYAVDFDGDGTKDIWNNPTDAIGSVANYFSEHGWRPNDQVVVRVEVDDVPEGVFNASLRPTLTAGDLRKLGVPGPLDDEIDVAPFLFKGKEGDEHWLGLKNFYVITRYNHSKLYAMAIYQLSEALKTEQGLAKR